MHGTGTEWLDAGLPTPTYFEQINKGYLIAYALNGYFGTQNGYKYLNDIIARFLMTFRNEKAQRLSYHPTITDKSLYSGKIYKLRELQNLKSLSTKQYAPERANNFDDHTFWAIKLYCEDLIRSQGMATAQQLEEFAYSNFEKDRSTLRAKCRSIWNYYERRDWKLPYQRKTNTEEELRMTRQERARSNSKAKAEKAKKAVITAVTGLYADEYKKKSGAWHIGKLSEATGIHREIVSKYLKLWEANKDGLFEECK